MKEDLLIHSCCAPCASAIIEKLTNDFNITLFFPDSNIWPAKEYQKRKFELQKTSLDRGLRLFITDYNYQEWKRAVASGLENAPEGGPRCFKCYHWRLNLAAQEAKRQHIKNLATTLSISPHKNSSHINNILKKICDKHNLNPILEDFGPLFSCSCELSKKNNFYRQKYCGCEFSINQNQGENKK